MALLEVRDLTFAYSGTSSPAVKNIRFALERGEFAVLCGATGSGKSTLMRLIKKELQPLGRKSGDVFFDGHSPEDLSPRESASRVGYVCQRPEQQLVTDKVWHELAFGLENLGLDQNEMRRRVAETACWFGIEDWFEKDTAELSGGQKQLLNLASVMVMRPDILLLDEPTSQLDPIAASDFISAVQRLNRELSITVLMTEHRLEEVFPAADRVLAMENGCLTVNSPTRTAIESMRSIPELCESLPTGVRLHGLLREEGPAPISIKEARLYVEKHFDNAVRSLPLPPESPQKGEPALELSDVVFRYGKNLPDVLRGLSLKVYTGEIFCILGGNGSGKSTLLSLAAGLNRPLRGGVKIFGQKIERYTHGSLYDRCVTLLPQDVQTVFLRNTLREELDGIDLGELPFDLSPLMDQHPYDLSGGQQQLAALAKALATKPRLLLMDEPTKGLDAHTRSGFADVIRRLRAGGVTVVCVTHDVEFASQIADRCALCFRGEIVSSDVTRRFLSGNSYYTTAANRIMRGRYENVSAAEDAALLLLKNRRRSDD